MSVALVNVKRQWETINAAAPAYEAEVDATPAWPRPQLTAAESRWLKGRGGVSR